MDGGRRLALAEEVAAAYEQEYGDNWQIDGSARSVLPVAPHSIAQHVSVMLRCYLT
jgi:hypothetical protein